MATCHYCGEPAGQACPTCGRLYCGEHGDDVCVRCMAPEAAVPGAGLYRGSLAALLIATAVAIFLLVRPPQEKSAADDARTISTVTPAINTTATPTRPGASTPLRTPTAAASPTSPAGRTYTVAPGDTLSGIASQFNTTEAAIRAANPGVNFDPLAAGAILTIPGP